eukprot:1158233-Pelagomonas_calceolata.AAC.10
MHHAKSHETLQVCRLLCACSEAAPLPCARSAPAPDPVQGSLVPKRAESPSPLHLVVVASAQLPWPMLSCHRPCSTAVAHAQLPPPMLNCHCPYSPAIAVMSHAGSACAVSHCVGRQWLYLEGRARQRLGHSATAGEWHEEM